MFAHCLLRWQNASMAVRITIRDVPKKVRDELASRAALQGKSMQEYLREELERLAARPSVEAWLKQVRKRKRASQTRISASEILEARDADRR
jgi:antitoxin FitA